MHANALYKSGAVESLPQTCMQRTLMCSTPHMRSPVVARSAPSSVDWPLYAGSPEKLRRCAAVSDRCSPGTRRRPGPSSAHSSLRSCRGAGRLGALNPSPSALDVPSRSVDSGAQTRGCPAEPLRKGMGGEDRELADGASNYIGGRDRGGSDTVGDGAAQ